MERMGSVALGADPEGITASYCTGDATAPPRSLDNASIITSIDSEPSVIAALPSGGQ